jgi:hypothetical protein
MAEYDRNGRVNTAGYDDAGNPIGGILTWDALGSINGIRWDLADEIGVTDRCLFFEGFVSDEEMGRFFSGTDFILLTYSASFHSQSGVLNVAAKARKLILASASPSPMMHAVSKYQLGITVEPDSMDAIVSGMRRLLEESFSPRWDDYEAIASWHENARGILEALKSQD